MVGKGGAAHQDEKLALNIDEAIEAAGCGRTLFYTQAREGRNGMPDRSSVERLIVSGRREAGETNQES